MACSRRVLIVTNFCSHYRAPLFQLLHERLGAEFIFFSEGTESYWQSHLGTTEAPFPHQTLTGRLRLGPGIRLNAALLEELWKRDFDVVIKCMNGRAELATTYAVARAKNRPFVLWTGMWMHPSSLFHWLSHPVVRFLYRHADSIVTYGHHVSEFVIQEGAVPEKVFVAENATDNDLYGRPVAPEEIAAFRERNKLGDLPLVLAVSRLVPQKGLEYLIEAVGRLPEPRLTLVVVGTGDHGPALENLASARGVRLRLLGGMQPSELPPVYAASQVFVMSSVTTRTIKETWGLACNEAMNQGVPVIATDAVGAAAGELIVDGQTGLVVPERDVSALAEAIRKLLLDPDCAVQLGAAGRKRVMQTNYVNMVLGFEQAVEYAMRQRH